MVNLISDWLNHDESIFNQGFDHVIDLSFLMFHLPIWIGWWFIDFFRLHFILLLSVIMMVLNDLLLAAPVLFFIAYRTKTFRKKVINAGNWILSPEIIIHHIILKDVFEPLVQARKLRDSSHFNGIFFIFLPNHKIFIRGLDSLLLQFNFLNIFLSLFYLFSTSVSCVELPKIIKFLRLLNCWIWKANFLFLLSFDGSDLKSAWLRSFPALWFILWVHCKLIFPMVLIVWLWLCHKFLFNIDHSFTFRFFNLNGFLFLNEFVVIKILSWRVFFICLRWPFHLTLALLLDS